MFKKILLATSGAPSTFGAARVAFDMAKRYGAEVVVFNVMGVPTKAFSQVVNDVRTGEEIEVDDEYRAWVEEELKSTFEKQIESVEYAKIVTTTGVPSREILRAARAEDADLIVMGASSGDSSAYRKGYPGSTLQRVAKAARCPVMTVHRETASYWGGFGNIVFATDFSKQAEYAFRFALNAARELDCDLTLFHALDISGKVMDQNAIEDKIITARNRIRETYGPLMGDFKNFDIEVWEGVPYVEVVKIARERSADLIVLAHHSRELDPDLASIGSTMEQVILRAGCPVVSVSKPDKV
ncbi:universal stress protein [Pseudodesulfovibrio thermohalotolerans]|jgi:nucleotide-binding universal stress UspA family protein|uniref:universal stress protein n=1 Tax=Pseudodesulfovibrio thermohalotolerans TaxID=2880651 RepID=UPI00244196BD|nr:universal stress protein [Pseudodesulfovibrio thermohalotolerans]WFS61898.1 universal stress protein [Pseudodesulfovibrio thermohalotolerans]